MTVGTTQTPDTLNLFAMALSISYTINFLVYDTLNSIDRNLNPGPQLAESWESNTDGTEWTYHLDPDATWHDEEPVTADDVVFTFNLVMENSDDETALWGTYVDGFESVVKVDAYTVKITTTEPKSGMLSIMVPVLPEHIWSAIPVDEIDDLDPWDSTYFPDGPIGSGPLILSEYDRSNGFIRLLKFADYHLDTVKVDEVLYKIFKTDDAMMTALYSSTIDVATAVPARVWDQTLGYDNIAGQVVQSLSIFELGINCMPDYLRTKDDFPTASDNLETTNLSVRQAIAHAVDKDQIVNEILKGLADKGDSLIPKATSYWHYNVTEEEEYDFDLDKARAILDRAGYTDIDDDGVRENETSEVELSFSFYYRSEKVDDGLAAGKISDWLSQIGIEAVPEGVTENSMYNLWYQCRMDLYIWAWDFDVDPSFALSVMTTDEIPDSSTDFTAWSDAFYTNPEYDQLYVDQLYTPDLAERQTIIHEMQQILYRDTPYVVLYYPYGLYAYRTDRFYNFPNMEAEPGATPSTMWFFFDVVPLGTNAPPANVDAGDDVSVYVGESLSFTGNATDLNDALATLNWTWTFTEPDDTTVTLWGRTVSYEFLNVGAVSVALTATDPGGLSDSDTIEVEVMELPEDSGVLMGVVSDSDGDPISGADVEIGDELRQTNADGFYSAVLIPGDYDVTVSAEGFLGASDSVTIAKDDAIWLNFTLEGTAGSLRVYITDSSTAEAIAGASVLLEVSTDSTAIYTNDQGFCDFVNVPAGEYTLSVSATGYNSNSTTVTIVVGVSDELTMMLTPASSDGGGGVSAVVLGAIVGLVAVVAVVAALMMMKRKKKGDDVPPPPVQ